MAMDVKQIAEAARALSDADTADLPPLDEAGTGGAGNEDDTDTTEDDDDAGTDVPASRKPGKGGKPKAKDDQAEDDEGTDEEGEDGADKEEGDEDDDAEKKKPADGSKIGTAWKKVKRGMKEVRVAREEISKERETLASEKREIISAKAAVENLAKSPLRALKAAGWTWEKLITHVAENGDIDEPEPDPKLTALERELQEIKAKEQRRDAQEKIKVYKNSIAAMVDDPKDGFPALRATKSYDLIYETAREIYKQTRKMPDTKAVAAELENEVLTSMKSAVQDETLAGLLGISRPTPGQSKDQRATTHTGSKPRSTISRKGMGGASTTPRRTSDEDYDDDAAVARAIDAVRKAQRSTG